MDWTTSPRPQHHPHQSKRILLFRVPRIHPVAAWLHCKGLSLAYIGACPSMPRRQARVRSKPPALLRGGVACGIGRRV